MAISFKLYKYSKNMNLLKIVAIGDVVGKAGKASLRKEIKRLREEHSPNLVIVNGENVSGGLGIELECYNDIMRYGADIITLGDHAFQKKHSTVLLNSNSATLIRPANYPPGAPGKGFTIMTLPLGLTVGIVNLMGRVFIEKSLDCPFRCLETLLKNELSEVPIVLVDFHGEATSEKIAFGRHFDGSIALVWGTHTHVQTNDAQILPRGTGYITDLGMSGPKESVIGMDIATAIARLTTGLPSQHKVANGDAVVNGIVAEIDVESRLTVRIETFSTLVRL
jgi:2',3'-cyclic-nucleotide 2'-phosphodiesterase